MKTKKKPEDDMQIIAQKITSKPLGNPQEMAMRIKQEAPTLANLNNEQLEQIARLVITQRLAAELNTAVDLAGIDWNQERETFLSDTKSLHTRRAYTAAIGKLEAWANQKQINLLAMNSAGADQFIRFLKEQGRASASTRRDVAAVSAFYTFLERATDGKIKNPVRGSRLRPPNENKKKSVVPLESDFEVIMAELPLTERAIVSCLALRGLRAGALPTLELKAGKYHGASKGKKLAEGEEEGVTLPPEALAAIKSAGLSLKNPFAWETRQKTIMSANGIESRVNKHLKKLFLEGKIRAAFSCHSFRHFFAVNEYKKSKDIFRVSKLLGHTNVTITQTYLKSIGVKL
jgi:site-specific recombinase XerD